MFKSTNFYHNYHFFLNLIEILLSRSVLSFLCNQFFFSFIKFCVEIHKNNKMLMQINKSFSVYSDILYCFRILMLN